MSNRAAIIERFDGGNYQQLADEFRLTVRQIKHVLSEQDSGLKTESQYPGTATENNHLGDPVSDTECQPQKPSCLDSRQMKRFRSNLIRAVRLERSRCLMRKELPRKSGVIAEIDLARLCDDCVQWASLEGIPLSISDYQTAILASPEIRAIRVLRATRLGRLRLKIGAVLQRAAERCLHI